MLQVRGESLAVGQEPIRFLTTPEITLWSTSVGVPGATKPDTGGPKLKGEYVWPFTITLPDTVNVSVVEKGPLAEYPLPPSCWVAYAFSVILSLIPLLFSL